MKNLIYSFILANTKSNDFILSYPYYPMLYFVLNRPNPSKDLIYFPRLWHQYDDDITLDSIRTKKVKYVVVVYDGIHDSCLSLFIKKQMEAEEKAKLPFVAQLQALSALYKEQNVEDKKDDKGGKNEGNQSGGIGNS